MLQILIPSLKLYQFVSGDQATNGPLEDPCEDGTRSVPDIIKNNVARALDLYFKCFRIRIDGFVSPTSVL